MSEEFETSYTPEEKNYLDTKGGEISPKETPPVEDGDASDEDDASPEDVSASDDTKDSRENEQPEQKERRGRVPLRQFRQEEERRKAAEREAQTLREQAARFDERLKMIYAAQQQNEPKDEAPDPSQDPIGAIQWQQRQIEAQRQAYEQQQQMQYQRAQIERLDGEYKRAFMETARRIPDLPMAYQHWTAGLSGFFEDQGIPDEQIDALVINEERKLANYARQTGKNPAEIIYNRALKYGYSPAPQETQDREAIEKAEKDIDRRQKAAAASKSISNASGSRGGRAPSAQELISMSDEEFAEMRSKMSDREFRRIAGG